MKKSSENFSLDNIDEGYADELKKAIDDRKNSYLDERMNDLSSIFKFSKSSISSIDLEKSIESQYNMLKVGVVSQS